MLDLVERVIGDTFAQNNLLLAAALLLKQNDTSFIKLTGHLSEVGIDISTTVLESFLRTRLNMRIRSGIVSMKNFPTIIGIGESNIDQIFWTPDFQNEIENNKNLDSVMLKKLATQKGEEEYSSSSSSIVNQILDDFL